MHGAGNDFVVLDCRESVPDHIGELAVRLCDRHTGIGADGLLLICSSDNADCAMRIINADGSEAEMCGNGIRCIGKYVRDNGIIDRDELTVETRSGLKYLTLAFGADGTVSSVSVDMGEAAVTTPQLELLTDSGSYDITAVSTGNPHAVVFNTKPDHLDIAVCGPQLENHAIWPDRSNIEFIVATSRHSLRQRTWERGAGETLACGTGAIAAAVAAVSRGLCDWPVSVVLDGGTLVIGFNPADRHIIMTGPAVLTFTGTV